MTSITIASSREIGPSEIARRETAERQSAAELAAFRRLTRDPRITITRRSHLGQPLAEPEARALSLEEEFEAEMLGFEIECATTFRHAERNLDRSAAVQFAMGLQAFLMITLSLLAFVWLAARLVVGI